MKKRLVIAVAALIVGIQFIPVDRDGLPPERPLQASAEVAAVLRASCYDCHSALTVWPWYSRVAPVSWYTARHVEEAREHLDFSRWGLMTAAEVAKTRAEIVEEIEHGEMPLKTYAAMHRGAEIDASELAILRRWAGVDDH